jgi:hypothetical protein
MSFFDVFDNLTTSSTTTARTETAFCDRPDA